MATTHARVADAIRALLERYGRKALVGGHVRELDPLTDNANLTGVDEANLRCR
jgi:hypothetical protein